MKFWRFNIVFDGEILKDADWNGNGQNPNNSENM